MRELALLMFLLAVPTLAFAQEDDDEWLERSVVTVRPGQNGAVQIVAYEGKDIEVHSRLQAGARVDLGQNESWSASFVIDAMTQNGPISVKNVVGKMEPSAQNGPLQLSGVGGDVHAERERERERCNGK